MILLVFYYYKNIKNAFIWKILLKYIEINYKIIKL